jgi:hypothetical protein
MSPANSWFAHAVRGSAECQVQAQFLRVWQYEGLGLTLCAAYPQACRHALEVTPRGRSRVWAPHTAKRAEIGAHTRLQPRYPVLVTF